MFAKESWATCRNGYSPMREEYFNTAFLVTEYGLNNKRKRPNGFFDIPSTYLMKINKRYYIIITIKCLPI